MEQEAFNVAAERGDLETVRWLVATFPDSTWSLGPAAVGGQLDVVIWLHQNANLCDGPPEIVFTNSSLNAANAFHHWQEYVEKNSVNRREVSSVEIWGLVFC